MNLSLLNDDQIIGTIIRKDDLIRKETTELLYYLAELEKRRLYFRQGCKSLFEFCVKVLKCSDGQAWRRVNAARALVALPEIREKVDSGELSLTTLSQAQSLFKREPRGREEKLEILGRLENTSSREAEKILVAESKSPKAQVREGIRPVTQEISEIRIAADHELLADLERLKEIWSHSVPDGNMGEIFKRMARFCLEKLDPEKKLERVERRKKGAGKTVEQHLERSESSVEQRTERSESSVEQRTKRSEESVERGRQQCKATPAPKRRGVELRSRYTKAQVKGVVWRRDGGSCTWINPVTGERCNSRHFIQYDHIVPFAKGGANTVENLRLRCFAHNQWHAILQFGREKVNRPRAP
jgi:hypothetical protein